jgi:SNF2 family DNA or RNA helicase
MKRSKKDVGIVLPDLTVHYEPVSWANVDERKMSHRVHLAVTYAHSFEKLKWMLFARQACILPRLLKSDAIIASPESYQGFTKIHAVIHAVLSNKDNGNGKLIFCHFREEIDIIVALLREAGIQKVCYFDGRVSQAQRTRYLAQQFEVIVLQIQTGCEGLNLQKGYSEIYFVSPHWNPAVEDQAVARCHRIGQIKPVHVYKFYMDHFQEDRSLTLDQYISHMQKDKREISNKVFS